MAEQNGVIASTLTYDPIRKARITSETFYDNLLIQHRDRHNRCVCVCPRVEEWEI